MPDGVPEEIQEDFSTSMRDSFLFYTGNGKTMYANRVSFVFDFKGPSMVIDTACSSSMVALDVAITDLRLGKSLKVYFQINRNVLNAYMKNMNK
jgi:acyl transferase domain-containing protein